MTVANSGMSENDYIKLIKEARSGDQKSFSKLAEMIRPRLYTYVFRIMLHDDVAQDIVQETMLEMFKVIGKLQKADRFWPWARGIAYNKIRRYRSDDKRWRTVSMFNEEDNNLPEDKRIDQQAGLSSLMSEELKNMIFDAMQELKPRQRAVLVMRCYEQMEYSKIAKLMKGSELGIRVLFFRAKKSLYQQLAKNGLGKNFLLAALVLFGKFTAPSKAAAAKVTVTAASTEVGMTANIIGTATSKSAAVILATAGVIAAGAAVVPHMVDQGTAFVQETEKNIQQVVSNWPSKLQLQGPAESWYYYPTDEQDTVMLRQVGSVSDSGQSWCYQLQNDSANYMFNAEENTVYINNFRKWNSDLKVWQLPNDDAKLSDFISKIEGITERGTVSKAGNNQLIIVTKGQKKTKDSIEAFTNANALSEGYFRFDWPIGTNVIDNRDTMHKRGWTYFQITGQINGEKVTGSGRIPFVYQATKEFYPWIKLSSGRYRVAANIQDNHKESAFAGLSRPWTGLHTIDIIRRDAAKQQIAFDTKYQTDSRKTQVVLTKKLENSNIQIAYSIDMEKDVVEKIVISVTEGDLIKEGVLEFNYLQEIDQVAGKFVEPKEEEINLQNDNGLLWLVDLIQNR